MPRELISGQRCEHVDRRVIDGAYTLVPCTVRHNDHSQGPPKQLVPIKEKRTVRFVCMAHAPVYRSGNGVYRRVKRAPPEEQEKLL